MTTQRKKGLNLINEVRESFQEKRTYKLGSEGSCEDKKSQESIPPEETM